VARRYLQVTLIAGLAVLISAPAVLARGAGCTRCSSRAAAHLAQGDPRDPFGHDGSDDSGSGGDSGTSDSGTSAGAGTGDGATSGSGVASAGTLPLTGSTTTLLAVVAGLLLAAGGFALWTTRYRPRHAGYRPRHAR
jgi:LPXTG-motif cell wall-anchored protein